MLAFVASKTLQMETHDTRQGDCPWRDVVAPEIENGGQSGDLERNQERLINKDWMQRLAIAHVLELNLPCTHSCSQP
jgi:hypothetical protein